MYVSQKQVKSFAEFLANVFKHILDASLFPEKFPVLNEFLSNVCGFDSVDDESKPEPAVHSKQCVN